MANQNRLTCQNTRCLAPQHALEYHVDHVYPRSTHPELALKLEYTRSYSAQVM